MSNASKMGRVDRRVKVPGTEVCSSDGFKRVYGDLYLADKDKVLLETNSFRCAFAKMEGHDKNVVSSCKVALIQHCGMNFGETSANQVLARLGVFLLEAERKGIR